MRKMGIAGLALAIALSATGCASSGGIKDAKTPGKNAGSSKTASSFEGEYEVNFTNEADGSKGVYDLFMIDDQGDISGAVEDSGYSGFIGKVNADGTFTASIYKLNGTMSGKIENDGTMKGKSEARGRKTTFVGKKK